MAGGCHSASVDPLALRAVPSGLPELLPSGAVKKWPAPGGTAGEAYFITAYSPNYASDGLILRASKFARGLLRSDSRGEHWRKVELPSLVVLDGGVPQQVVHSIVFSPSFAADQTVYVAGFNLGITRSTDGGHTFQVQWRANGYNTHLALSPDFSRVDPQPKNRALVAVLSPPTPEDLSRLRDGTVLDAGAGEVKEYLRETPALGDEMFLSEDAGETWHAA